MRGALAAGLSVPSLRRAGLSAASARPERGAPGEAHRRSGRSVSPRSPGPAPIPCVSAPVPPRGRSRASPAAGTGVGARNGNSWLVSARSRYKGSTGREALPDSIAAATEPRVPSRAAAAGVRQG